MSDPLFILAAERNVERGLTIANQRQDPGARAFVVRFTSADVARELNELIREHPDAVAPRVHLAAHLFSMGDRALSHAMADRITGADRAPELELIFADIAAQDDDLEGALDALEEAVELAPKFAAAHAARARIFEKQGRLADAEAAWIACTKAAPNDASVWASLIALEIKGGATRAARENLERARRAVGDDPALAPLEEALAEKRKKKLCFDPRLLEVLRALDEHDPQCAVRLSNDLASENPKSDEAMLARGALAGAGLLPSKEVCGLILELTKRFANADDSESAVVLAALHLKATPLFNAGRALTFAERAWQLGRESSAVALLMVRAWLAMRARRRALRFGQMLKTTAHPAAAAVNGLLG